MKSVKFAGKRLALGGEMLQDREHGKRRGPGGRWGRDPPRLGGTAGRFWAIREKSCAGASLSHGRKRTRAITDRRGRRGTWERRRRSASGARTATSSRTC